MKLGILGSGKGSNFAAILAAVRAGELPAEIALVACDVPGAGILQIAAEAGLPTYEIDEPRYRTRLSPDVEERLAATLQRAGVELIALAGYMRVVKGPLLDAYPRRIINIHPSLLPAFRGIAAWEQALAAGVATAGCTVHYVDHDIDTGEIIAQAQVPVLPGDTAETLHARIQIEEHRLYPKVLAQLARELAQ